MAKTIWLHNPESGQTFEVEKGSVWEEQSLQRGCEKVDPPKSESKESKEPKEPAKVPETPDGTKGEGSGEPGKEPEGGGSSKGEGQGQPQPNAKAEKEKK